MDARIGVKVCSKSEKGWKKYLGLRKNPHRYASAARQKRRNDKKACSAGVESARANFVTTLSRVRHIRPYSSDIEKLSFLRSVFFSIGTRAPARVRTKIQSLLQFEREFPIPVCDNYL